MKVVIASKNPVKITSTKTAFTKVFPNLTFEFEGISVPSGVCDQPMSSIEALTGATNRAEKAALTIPDADYFVGLEGGVEDRDGKLYSFSWIVVRDKTGKLGMGKSGEFVLPPKVRELILDGMELGHADDIVFGKKDSKLTNGAIGILTNDIIDRAGLYTPAVIFALIPFLNPELY
ncbi:MAG: inosine/xanthosine triphosphatase [bacterium]|nr:inosine/xanthosine triphosphatase [bacterium]